MDIAVIGGRGFVGSAVTGALRDDHDVTTVDPGDGGEGHVTADVTDRDSITAALEGVDAAVNLVGLTPIRKPLNTSYEAVHVDGAANVVAACEEHNVRRLVHMSALGADPDASTEYLRTKGEGRERVLEADLDVTVLEPSIIFDRENELVQMAERFAPTRVFPYLRTRIQPVYRGDVAELFRLGVDGEVAEDVLAVGGPDTMNIFGFAKKIYNAKGYRCYPLPVHPVLSGLFYLLEFLPGAYGADQARFLSFDNTLDENDAVEYVELTRVGEWARSEF